MKTLFSILFLAVLSTSIAGEFEVKLDDFTELKARGNYKVTLKKGEENVARIINNDPEVDDEKFELEVEGNVLEVKIKGDIAKERDVEIIITYKTLYAIESYRGCWLIAEDVLEGDEITLKVDTGGKIKASVDTKSLTCKILSGGSIRVKGKTDFAEYSISAGGTIGAIDVECPNTLAKVKAGGEVICTANDKLEIKITTGGTVSYKGTPKELKEKVLGGTIEKLKD